MWADCWGPSLCCWKGVCVSVCVCVCLSALRFLKVIIQILWYMSIILDLLPWLFETPFFSLYEKQNIVMKSIFFLQFWDYLLQNFKDKLNLFCKRHFLPLVRVVFTQDKTEKMLEKRKKKSWKQRKPFRFALLFRHF